MVKKSISELDDILATQEPSAVCAIEQNGATFKAPVRPNPVHQVNVSTQAQLEAEFGVNIEIPDGDDVAIVVDDSFTLTKPIKIGLGSSLEISGATFPLTITYTGTGAMFQNTTITDLIQDFVIHDIFLQGNTTNDIFDIEATANFLLTQVQAILFDTIGQVGFSLGRFIALSLAFINKGLVVRQPGVFVIRDSGIQNGGATGITCITIFDVPNPMNVTIDNFAARILFAGDSMVFLDSNTPSTSAYTVENSGVIAADLYQQGTDIAINSVADNGSGNVRHTTASAHGLAVGRPVVISAFVTQTTYNGTFIVTAVDVAETGVTFDVDVAFVATDTGNMNKASLDNTDIRVSSQANVGEADSMFTADAGLELFGVEITSSSLAQNVFEVITSASWAFSNLERFTIGVNNEGQLITDDLAMRRYTVSFSGTLEKSGGGSVNIGVVILKNGGNISFNAPHTVNTGKIQISGSDLVELTSGDTVQIAVINYDATAAAIDISQISMVINLA